MYKIYLITNLNNGKGYVGLTKLSLRERFQIHCRPSSNCTILIKAIIKHGKENFKIELLETSESKEVAELIESIYICDLKTEYFNNGYNLSSGGTYAGGHSELTRKKMSKSKTGVKRGPMSQEQRDKLSKTRLERGIRLSPESIEKGRQKLLGKKYPKEFGEQISNRQRGGDNPTARKVQSSTGEVFNTIKEASDWCKVTPSTIGHCLRELNPTGGKHPETKEKLKWKYL